MGSCEDGTFPSVSHFEVTDGARPQAGPVRRDECRLREVLDRVGDKWSVLVIYLLGDRSRRFTELLRSIDGISQRMLTVTLRAWSATAW